MFCFLARRPASSLFSEVTQRITFSILLAFLTPPSPDNGTPPWKENNDLLPFNSSSFNIGRRPTPRRDLTLVEDKTIFSSSTAAPSSKMMSVMHFRLSPSTSKHLRCSNISFLNVRLGSLYASLSEPDTA
ncbi:Os06g0314425 [Oryza sativa Japonica Group]|uniref:Os06g0314425 protein n=1 Tax=Oryza sativa subsp. japonica TaxID=39947 RepID=A0A0N7KM03_ORYSJ|nr:hypothetical protein EE612_033656 [Oryza sativa]BAS97457.1 Os06g0314425 [Oryza sativa Japonica Group]